MNDRQSTYKRQYQVAVGAACALAGAGMGALLAETAGAIGGAVVGGSVGALIARTMAPMLRGDWPPHDED